MPPLSDIWEVHVMEWVFSLLMGCIGAAALFIAVKITIWIETPIIVRSGITENKKFIAAINSITNTAFNLGLLFIAIKGFWYNWHAAFFIGWHILWEFILIPVTEIFAYKAISSASDKQIVIFTYVANLASFFIGIVVGFILYGLLYL